MEGDQCYELWIDDIDTITFHENFDKEFFGKNVHLQNMCNLMSLGNLTPDGEEDDFDDLEDLFFGDDSLPVENGTSQNGTLNTRSVTPPSLKVDYNTVQVDIGMYFLIYKAFSFVLVEESTIEVSLKPPARNFF